MESSLNLSENIKLKFLEKSASYYLNKSTILFGASDTGKTTILLEMLYLLKDQVPNIFVFAPTADANNAFTGIVPSPLIFTEVDIAKVTAIYERQQSATKTYNLVNNIKSLKKLFDRIADDDIRATEALAISNAASIIQRKESGDGNFAEKRSAVLDVEKLRDEYLVKLYKAVIRSSKIKLDRLKLTKEERYIVMYLDFNPYCIIVFDDCAAELKKFQKEEVMKKIIFQGRHSFINIILTVQDDTNLDSAIKKNSFVNIFTSSQCASAYFERKSNYFTKKEREFAEKVIAGVFTSTSTKKDHKKMVYLRNTVDPFRYTIADIYGDFKFGCPSLWNMCNKLTKHVKCDFDNDPLMAAFKIDI